MADHRRGGKLAVILHADIAGSTSLVHQDEHLAHERIQTAFRRFGDTIARYHGRVRELRGDALLAEFERSSDAVTAALAFQADQTEHNAQLNDAIRPTVRVGIAMGEVVFADRTVTGAGVILGQRMEQLAEPGGVCIAGAIHESLPQRMPFDQESLGEQEVKGFDEPVRVYTVRLQEGVEAPQPAELSKEKHASVVRGVVTAAVVVLICGGGLLAWYQPWTQRVEAASVERMAYPLPDETSIAVLPFENLTGRSEQEYLVDGFTENIITELSRFKEFFVIARNSTFVYKGEPVKVRQVAEELGVRYVVEGSVQTMGDRVRITVQLIDAISGRHLWAERFDRDLQDIFTVQDEIIQTIAATLEESIDLAEYDRIRREPVDNLKAYELSVRALAQWQTFTREGTEQAKQLWEKALALEPNYYDAYRGLALVYVNGYRWGWTTDNHSREESINLALEMARKALELDPFSYHTHWTAAKVKMHSGDLDSAIAAYDRAMELNPNDAGLLAESATSLIYSGRAQEAVSRIETAMRLNPRYPDWYLWSLAWAQYFAGQYEEAVASMKRMNKVPNMGRRILAAGLVRLGQLDEARSLIAEFRKNAPDYTVKDMKMLPFEHKEYLERWIEDLRKSEFSLHHVRVYGSGMIMSPTYETRLNGEFLDYDGSALVAG